MQKIISHYFLNRQGAITVVSALMMPVILGFTGLGVDAGMWIKEKRQLQTAADAAALAAAHEIANGFPDNAEAAALKEAQNNGYSGNTVNLQLGTNNEAVAVSLGSTQQFLFSRVLFGSGEKVSNGVTISTTAAAQVSGGGGGGVASGDGCLLTLDPAQAGALTFSGASNLTASGCDVYVNSTDNNAIQINGQPGVNVDEVNVAGGVSDESKINANSINTGAAATDDPYADLDTPDYIPCNSGTSATEVNNGNVNFQPDANNLKVFCGGLNISGGTVDFAPGVYVIDGGNFHINGNTTVTGDNVTFILTNTTGDDSAWADVIMNGTADVNLSASTAGSDYEGILFYQDRNAPEGIDDGEDSEYNNKLLGTANTNLDGVSYFPSRTVQIGGNNSSNNPCSIVAARRIHIHGSANIGNNCTSDSGVTSIGGSSNNNGPGAGGIKLIHVVDFNAGNYGSGTSSADNTNETGATDTTDTASNDTGATDTGTTDTGSTDTGAGNSGNNGNGGGPPPGRGGGPPR